MDTMTVGEVARATGVTVRTLHHYDRIGLVVPAERTASGYRVYGRAELERLQEVLFLRELGFALHDIAAIVDDPDHDRAAALGRQRRMLEAKAEHLLAMLDTIDRTIAAHERGTPMANDEMIGVFGDFDPASYAEEAEERWGGTDAYRESQRRTSRYTRQDWERMRAEASGIDEAFVALMDAGTPPGDPAAREVALRHRAHISAWFYECTPEIHAGLAAMYVADARFAERIDRTRAGLAAYMSAAITAAASD